jgi:RNA polymerase sigma factor (sigma-70 family)
VWHSLRRLGVPDSQIPDAVHEVFVAAHGAYGTYDPSRPVRPWLFAHALHVVARRPAVKPEETPAKGADEQPQSDDDKARARVIAALGTLDLERRAVVILRDLDETPMADIAAALGVSEKALEARLRIAREEVAKAVRATGG